MAVPSNTHRRSAPDELFRTPEMDEEDKREAGLKPVRELFFRIIAVADDLFVERPEPARSRMIVEAECFGVSHVIFHSRKWYRKEGGRRKFIDALKSEYTFISAIAADSPKEDQDTLRSAYESLLDLRECEYRTIRVAFHNRLFRAFLGEVFVDEVFLTERIQNALSEVNVSVPPPAVEHFVKRTVREVHQARAAISRRNLHLGPQGWEQT